MARILAFSAAAGVLMACAAPSALAQESEYFLLGQAGGRISVVQGGAVQRQWKTVFGSAESSIAVSDFVRTNAHTAGNSGAEYTLEGVDTGNRYPHPGGIGSFFDSTSDGEFNYIVQFGGTGPVFVTDLDYSNPVKLFDSGATFLGITLDTSNNSLWLSTWGGTPRIVNFDMDGNILSEFTPDSSLNTALALDPADGTLWGGDRSSGGRYVNYAKDGTKLGEMRVGDIAGDNTLGGEFVVNAAPGCHPCDADCDGSVDLTDVEPFIELILGKAKPCDWCSGDTNDDGSIDLADVELFIECMLG